MNIARIPSISQQDNITPATSLPRSVRREDRTLTSCSWLCSLYFSLCSSVSCLFKNLELLSFNSRFVKVHSASKDKKLNPCAAVLLVKVYKLGA